VGEEGWWGKFKERLYAPRKGKKEGVRYRGPSGKLRKKRGEKKGVARGKPPLLPPAQKDATAKEYPTIPQGKGGEERRRRRLVSK